MTIGWTNQSFAALASIEWVFDAPRSNSPARLKAAVPLEVFDGAGRYLEPEPLGDGQFLLDFNLAYNPYCAYHDAWSCPITPIENRLRVPIRAGEKVFSEHVELGVRVT